MRNVRTSLKGMTNIVSWMNCMILFGAAYTMIHVDNKRGTAATQEQLDDK